jgi:hypothetical protein
VAQPGKRSMIVVLGPRGRRYTGEDVEVRGASAELFVAKPGHTVARDGDLDGGARDGTNGLMDGSSQSSSRWPRGIGS